MKHISVGAFKEVLQAESSNSSVDFINVCTPAEYKEKHIDGVRSVPLDEIEKHVAEFKDKKTVYVHCRSGRRGQQAIEKLHTLGITAELVNVEGGILAWEEAGFGTKALTTRLPIMRQTFIAAGALIVLSHILYLQIGSAGLWLSAFVGAGLLFAGLTGWCGMAFILSRAPWNK
jgi:rhodanese-related sulfurtransferase